MHLNEKMYYPHQERSHLTIIRFHLPRLSCEAITVVLLTLIGGFVRLYGLGIWDYSTDEIWHYYVSRQPSAAGVFYTDLIVDGHPILPYLIWHYLLPLWDDPWMAKLPALIAGIITIPLGYPLGKELFGTKGGGLFAAFFMAFANLLIEESDVVRGYALMIPCAMAGLWCALRYRHTPWLYYLLLYFMAMGLALLCEFSAIPVTVFTALYLLYGIYRQPKPRLLAFSCWAAIHLALLAYLLWFVAMLRNYGGLDFSHASFFLLRNAYTLSFNIVQTVDYLMEFINDIGFFDHLGLAAELQPLSMLIFLANLTIVVAGFAWLVRMRQYGLLLRPSSRCWR